MKRILIIENNKVIRNNISDILTLASYEVIATEHPHIACELAFKQRPQIILCSNQLPGVDGFKVYEEFKENELLTDCSFILLTQNLEWQYIKAAIESGIDDVIPMPLNNAYLLSAVANRLADGKCNNSDLSKFKLNSVSQYITTFTKNSQLEGLLHYKQETTYKKKSIIYKAGSFPTSVYFIKSGSIKTYRKNEEGKELICNIYQRGDFFGYVSLLLDERRTDNAEAMEDCELIQIPCVEFLEVILAEPKIIKLIMKLLTTDIVEKEGKMLNFAYNSLRKKIAKLLVDLYEKYAETGETNQDLIKISRENLAALIGVAKESVIRTLKDFKNEQLIELTHNSFKITNFSKLRNMVN